MPGYRYFVSLSCQPGHVSHCTSSPPARSSAFKRIINIEKSTFTPLVFSTSGGMGEEAEAFHKRLATLLSQKRGNSYSETMSFVRRRLRFSILRSCLAAVRGYRGKSCSVDSDIIDINLIIPKEASYY